MARRKITRTKHRTTIQYFNKKPFERYSEHTTRRSAQTSAKFLRDRGGTARVRKIKGGYSVYYGLNKTYKEKPYRNTKRRK